MLSDAKPRSNAAMAITPLSTQRFKNTSMQRLRETQHERHRQTFLHDIRPTLSNSAETAHASSAATQEPDLSGSRPQQIARLLLVEKT